MKKLELIRQKCQESIDEYESLLRENPSIIEVVERARAELADEILEIINGENI